MLALQLLGKPFGLNAVRLLRSAPIALGLLSERLDAPITVSSVIREGLTPVVLPAKTERQTNAEDDFKNDPLIQKALEIFQAEIQAAD